jgi:hypothetical protein
MPEALAGHVHCDNTDSATFCSLQRASRASPSENQDDIPAPSTRESIGTDIDLCSPLNKS